MKVTIFGASGVTGQILTQQALRNGYEVVAYVHSFDSLKRIHKNLTIVQGELNNQASIEKALAGTDVVISIFGPKNTSLPNPISEEMKLIINAMARNGIKRLIVTATPMAVDLKDKFDLKFKLSGLLFRIFLPHFYDDILRTSALIRKSNLDWTIIRIPVLTNRKLNSALSTGYVGDGKIRLSEVNRFDLAGFLLSQIGDNKFLHQAPVVNA